VGVRLRLLREILAKAGIGALLPLNALEKVSAYRRDVPADVYYAAKITAAIGADCGPCAQLVVTMAEAAGVDLPILRAVVSGERDSLPYDAALGVDLARATLLREPGVDVREAIVQRWGQRALVSLAYGIVAAQAYPAFKYAIGHGHECSHLRVGGVDVARRDAIPA
jgi:hypothetical protein